MIAHESAHEKTADPIADLVRKLNAKLDPQRKTCLLCNLRHMLQTEVAMKTGEGCAGTGIMQHILNMFSQAWSEEYDLEIKFDHAWKIENDPLQQKFLRDLWARQQYSMICCRHAMNHTTSLANLAKSFPTCTFFLQVYHISTQATRNAELVARTAMRKRKRHFKPHWT